MKTINNFIIERLILNKDTKIHTEEERILVFPLYMPEHNQINNFIENKEKCIKLKNNHKWTIFIIPNKFINDLINKLNKLYCYEHDRIYIHKFPNNMTIKEFEKEWDNIDGDFDEIKAYLEKYNKVEV